MTAFKGALSTVLQNNRPVTKRPKLYSIRAPRHCKLQALLENIAPSKIQALPHCALDMNPKRKQQLMERFEPLRKLFIFILLSVLSVYAYQALNAFYGGTIGNKAVY